MSVAPLAAAQPSVHVPSIGRTLPLLIGVTEAGQLAGLGRDSSYRAVAAGAMPSLRVGHRVHVRTVEWLDTLGLAHQPVEVDQ